MPRSVALTLARTVLDRLTCVAHLSLTAGLLVQDPWAAPLQLASSAPFVLVGVGAELATAASPLGRPLRDPLGPAAHETS